jgi:hypothetical protein
VERNFHSKVMMSVTPNSKHRFLLIHKMAFRNPPIVGKVPVNRQTNEIYLGIYIFAVVPVSVSLLWNLHNTVATSMLTSSH